MWSLILFRCKSIVKIRISFSINCSIINFPTRNMTNLIQLHKYYINLDYVELNNEFNKHEAMSNISNITRNIKLKSNNLLHRIVETSDTITNNLHLFQSVCSHSDIPLVIANYLLYYPNMIRSHDFTSEKGKQKILTLILSLLNFCANQQEIQYFLETSLITNSSLNKHQYEQYKSLLSHQTIEIILLEDSDLYAVINYLKISENCQYLSKLWVPRSIKSNFLSLQHKYLHFKNLNNAIHIYTSKQDLLTPPIFYKINVTSIWSEDITAARNLAASLDRNIVLINTLDYYDGMVIMPYVEIFKVPLYKQLELNEEQYIINTIKPIDSTSFNKSSKNSLCSLLFYNGTWQKPVKDLLDIRRILEGKNYWISNKTLIANATSDDISKCVASAREGFKIWSTWSTKSRMQVLCKFASALKSTGKAKLSEIIFKWINFPYLYNSLVLQYSTLTARTHKPKGVITLMEKNEMDLFRKLTQGLIIGNSVIVIHTTQSCSLAQYCDLISSSGIPPGVINLLSFKDIKPLSECYDATELTEMYYQFTVSKQIITHYLSINNTRLTLLRKLRKYKDM